MRLDLGLARYEDHLGKWSTCISLSADRYRLAIRGIVFEGPLDGLTPQLAYEVRPRPTGDLPVIDGHYTWRPTQVMLQRQGDHFEARAPAGIHAGRVIVDTSDRVGDPPIGGWPPVPVAAGFASDGGACLELCTGRVEFEVRVAIIGANGENAQLGVLVDFARAQVQLTLKTSVAVRSTEWQNHLEVALESLSNQLGAQFYIRRCFFCLFSDYSYCGTALSGMACFRDVRERYLAVRSKSDYIPLFPAHVTEWVDELYLCPEFSPRIPGTGYRG